MKLDRRRVLFLLTICLQGCGGGQDRQMIYPAPRGTAIQASPAGDGRARAPLAKGRSLDNKRPSPSNGVDVPIIEQD